jgi:hypothetical protein
MIFSARRPITSTKRIANIHLDCGSDLGHEPIEHCQKRIDNCLAKRIGGLSDLFVGHVSGGEGEIATLFRNDGTRPLDRPLGKSLRFSMDIVSVRVSSFIYDFFSVGGVAIWWRVEFLRTRISHHVNRV